MNMGLIERLNTLTDFTVYYTYSRLKQWKSYILQYRGFNITSDYKIMSIQVPETLLISESFPDTTPK